MNRVSMASKRPYVFLVCLAFAGCAAHSPLLRQQCYNADAQLASVMQPLEALRAKGCTEGIHHAEGSQCDLLESEVAHLAVVCPGHAPTLMANAVISYDNHRPEEAQQFLDQILSQPRPYADAAVLRARIALEQGNVPFARRLLEQQIKLVPDHAGLHETYAAALFLDKRLDDARAELTKAGALGAPRWRVAYHLGVIEELSGRPDEAARLYMEALQGNPGWAAADSRLRGLRAASPPATATPR
jgi:tetratricopeptide (TPR) repeat protein